MPGNLANVVIKSPAARAGAGLLVGLLILGGCAMQARVVADAVRTEARRTAEFSAIVSTERGDLSLVLDAQTAPQAVAAIRTAMQTQGYDGVTIEWIRPHTEIRTGLPRAAGNLDSELDAVVLGLDQQRIEDAGAAMNAIQFELEPAFVRAGAGASVQLREWIATWRRDFDPGFLIGVTRQQINEALGYRYQAGHASRPARRGSVALVPGKPGTTTLALAILLRDQPKRDGCWVVIGKVVSGLELVDSLSIAPRLHPKSFEPLQPTRITRTHVSGPHSD